MHGVKIVIVGITLSTLGACDGCKSTENEPCEDDGDCRSRLVCRSERCVVGEVIFEDMARQSGVPIAREQPVAVSGPGSVHVRSATGDEVAFALCAANERLLGGWCDPPGSGGDSTSFTYGGATGYTKQDTVGARWKCLLEGKPVRAFALCQVLGP